jgi:hypothetical protein
MKLTTSASRVELPREETGGCLEDLIRPAQLAVVPLQLGEAPAFLAGHTRTVAAVDLGLADPAPQRLAADAEPPG